MNRTGRQAQADRGPRRCGRWPDVALIARDGSVDFRCRPRLDSDSPFDAILGDDGHGHWRITPSATHRGAADDDRHGALTRLAQRINDTVCKKGFDAKRNSLMRAFGDDALDGFLLPLVGFLPVSDPRVAGTSPGLIDAVLEYCVGGISRSR